MPARTPVRVSIDEVHIIREGDDAVVVHSDKNFSNAHIAIGAQIVSMTDADIVRIYNDILAAQQELLAGWDRTVVEEPPGTKQITYSRRSGQWVPRGDVLRCVIEDGGPDGEVTFRIDDKELSLAEFGQLLRTHAGWGMRLAFVPEEFVTESPTVEIRGTEGSRLGRRR